MGMSWYFALSESSIERGEHDWRGLIRVAVKSAYSNTRLQPTLVYDGQPGEFTAELENIGVKVIYHRVSFFDDLVEHAANRGLLTASENIVVDDFRHQIIRVT